jgi:hypothetical protein
MSDYITPERVRGWAQVARNCGDLATANRFDLCADHIARLTGKWDASRYIVCHDKYPLIPLYWFYVVDTLMGERVDGCAWGKRHLQMSICAHVGPWEIPS